MRKRECPFFIAKIPHIEVIFMQTQVNFSYFYGEESEQFSYFRIPRLLVRSKKFKTLSTDAKLLYGLMLDRMGLSAKHGWYDELGRVYIYYTLDEIQTDLMCGHNKAVRLLAELDTGKTGFRENYWAVTRICLPNGEKSYMIMNGLQSPSGRGPSSRP